jgi:2-methylcitrate dehydratase PrpD
MTASEALACWASGPVTIPDDVLDAARAHLIDGIGTALGARCRHAVEPTLAVVRGLAGPPEATVLGTRDMVGAPAAALANGALVHGLDFDDTHASALVHPTSVVLPAALAVAEEAGADGRAFLEALVVGNEVVCRIASAAPHGFHARGVHATSAAGVFSSAAVAARLMGLDAATTADALGVAASQAGGLLTFLNSEASTKQLQPGMASHAGILAARLARAGAVGPTNVFEGPHSIYDAMTEGAVDLGRITDGLGETWETARIGFKPYPACQLLHVGVDATFAATGSRPLPPGEIDWIEVGVHPDAASIVCEGTRDLAHPATSYAAKFSLPWCVAVAAVDAQVTLDTFDHESLARANVAAVAGRVRWQLIAREGNAADAPGWVRIGLVGGEVLEGRVPCSSGTVGNPFSDAELKAKFTANAHAPAETVANEVERLAAASSLRPLVESVAAAAGAATITR